MGGTGYLTMDNKMQALDKKIEINSVQLAAVTNNLEDVKKLMVRIDDKLDRKK